MAFITATTSQAGYYPDYVTGWPKVVELESPDPILGDKPFWEHWAYSKKFAQRFKGFDLDGAAVEFDKDIQAMALRVFKSRTNHFSFFNAFPIQYHCELEIYFNSDINLSNDNPVNKKVRRWHYPKNSAPTYFRLEAYNEKEKKQLDKMESPFYVQLENQGPTIFASPLDGRTKQFGVTEYHPDFVDGLSLIIVKPSIGCGVTVPLQENGNEWISLMGIYPWGPNAQLTYFGGSHFKKDSSFLKFEEVNQESIPGFSKIPRSFSDVLLPKITLIRSINKCIYKKELLYKTMDDKIKNWHPTKGRDIVKKKRLIRNWNEIQFRCDQLYKEGFISEISVSWDIEEQDFSYRRNDGIYSITYF